MCFVCVSLSPSVLCQSPCLYVHITKKTAPCCHQPTHPPSLTTLQLNNPGSSSTPRLIVCFRIVIVISFGWALLTLPNLGLSLPMVCSCAQVHSLPVCRPATSTSLRYLASLFNYVLFISFPFYSTVIISTTSPVSVFGIWVCFVQPNNTCMFFKYFIHQILVCSFRQCVYLYH